jgi:hypothetical protein
MLVKDVMVKDVGFVSIPGNRDEVLKTLFLLSRKAML